MSEFATRDEMNGLGSRLNGVEKAVAGIERDTENSKLDRRDIWGAIAKGRDEDQRIERMVNAIAIKVAGIATVATLAQAFIVWYFTKGG